MPISFECSDCSTALKVKEQYAGRKVRCPNCDAVNQVPVENGEADEDDIVSRPRSSSSSSRSEQSRRSQSRRSRMDDDDDLTELPQKSKRKKKGSQKSGSDSGGVPVWAIVAGSSLVGVLIVGGIVLMLMKPSGRASNTNVAGGGNANPPAAAEKPKVVQAQLDGPGASFRMKFEMPLNWTSEGGIERDRWPWATMKGQGQTIKLSTNRSLASGAETMTTKGGAAEQLKMSHTLRGGKLQAENTDWVDGPLSVHPGKFGPVVWSDYEYKGLIGKGYGIRCTVVGPSMPCTLMLECSQSARDKWRPTLLAISESIHYVRLNKKGEEMTNDFGDGPGDDGPGGEMPNADQTEMDGNADGQE